MVDKTLIERLAEFACGVCVEELPSIVLEDCKRVVLDSIGCALAGIDIDKGRIGVHVGRMIGGAEGEATIYGTPYRTSAAGAAFVNAESINALDFDSVLPPGHVAPYVLPAALAVGEQNRVSGDRLVAAVAAAHEMSYRIGLAMDYHRTPKGYGMVIPSVLGFTSTVFGATAAVAIVQDCDAEVTANALGIAGAITPVNSYRAWMHNVPNASIKYTMPGPVAQAALIASYSAQFGHSGDRKLLDDADFGYRRFIGTQRWEPEVIMSGLGAEWKFPDAHSYKPYPHCRVMHAPLDALIELVTEHDIKPDEIDAIRCWGEAWVEQPVWLNKDVHRPHEAQFSIAHGLAVGAHRIPPGPAWQQPETLRDPSVLRLMEKVVFAPHPDYVSTLTQDPSARPTRVEIDARGTTLVATRKYPKGTPSPDPGTYMTTEELVEKFQRNADGVLSDAQVERLVEGILHLDEIDDIRDLIRAAGKQDQ